jgi:hypothetical protein
MRLDIETLVKRHRRVTGKPLTTSCGRDRSSSSLGLFKVIGIARGLDHPRSGQLPLPGPLEEHELRRDSRER